MCELQYAIENLVPAKPCAGTLGECTSRAQVEELDVRDPEK